jgi:hypothetical protein
MDLPSSFLGFANMAASAFGAPFYDGQIITQTDPVYDDGGSIVTPAQPVFRACKVQIDAATEAMQQREGFADGDVRFIILSASFTGPLDTDANVSIASGPFAGEWQVSTLQRDPAGIGYVGKGRRA